MKSTIIATALTVAALSICFSVATATAEEHFGQGDAFGNVDCSLGPVLSGDNPGDFFSNFSVNPHEVGTRSGRYDTLGEFIDAKCSDESNFPG